jgi:hypothetical protein
MWPVFVWASRPTWDERATPEVQQLHVALDPDPDVLGLDVAMDQLQGLLGVRGFGLPGRAQRVGHPADHRAHGARGHHVVAADALREVLAFDVLGDQADPTRRG